jgi:hypothetical protein
VGSWAVLPFSAPLLPIHVALLNTGKVLMVAGSGNNPANHGPGLTNDSAVWNPSAGNVFAKPATPVDAAGIPVDMFCIGHSFRSDGTLLVAGGTLQYDPFEGLTAALLFDPATERWVTASSMSGGRWYPTLVTLGTGRVLAVSGLDTNGGLNGQPELSAVDPRSGSWNIYPPTNSPFPLYANLFLLTNGQLFYSGGSFGSTTVTPRLLTLPPDPGQGISEVPVDQSSLPAQVQAASDQAASVLLPPAQNQRVMIIGGNDGSTTGMPVNRVAVTSDLSAMNPVYTAAPSITYARMHHCAVLLPNRTVLVCNGSGMPEDPTRSMLPAEIYDPATNSWAIAETPTVPRVYHSIALLLPDGRVLTAGGNQPGQPPELRLEIYSPSYMTQRRPVIKSAPGSVAYGATLKIQSPQTGSIKWVNLIRPSANTHSCDTEQRLVDVPITGRSGSVLSATVTANPNLAPPGWYMLFLTDTAGTPSTANWIHLG